jgi:hypothetical protein
LPKTAFKQLVEKASDLDMADVRRQIEEERGKGSA